VWKSLVNLQTGVNKSNLPAIALFCSISPSLGHPLTILHSEASTGWGGQEIRVFTELTAMRRRGHRMLLAAPPSSQIFQQAEAAKFHPWPLDLRKPLYPLTIVRLARWISREQVDVVNPHSSADGWLAGLAGRAAGVPLIVRSRHIEVDYPHWRTSRWAFGRLPHHVITTSKGISKHLVEALRLKADHVTCIPTGIDTKRFHPNTHGNLHEELGLPAETQLLGMVAVLRSWKGHEYFIRAAGRMERAKPHLVIAGEGNQARKMKIQQWAKEAGVANRLHMLGYRADIPNILASLSCLVLPSTAHEGIPQIVLQAQATGRPVVGTKVGGIPEVVKDGDTGLLVPSQNTEALADALERVLKDKNLAHSLGRGGRAQSESNHSLDAMCNQLEILYQRYLSGSNS